MEIGHTEIITDMNSQLAMELLACYEDGALLPELYRSRVDKMLRVVVDENEEILVLYFKGDFSQAWEWAEEYYRAWYSITNDPLQSFPGQCITSGDKVVIHLTA